MLQYGSAQSLETCLMNDERLLFINHGACVQLEIGGRLCADRGVKFGREASKQETELGLAFSQGEAFLPLRHAQERPRFEAA